MYQCYIKFLVYVLKLISIRTVYQFYISLQYIILFLTINAFNHKFFYSFHLKFAVFLEQNIGGGEGEGVSFLKVVNIPLLSYFFKTAYLVSRNSSQPYALPSRKMFRRMPLSGWT